MHGSVSQLHARTQERVHYVEEENPRKSASPELRKHKHGKETTAHVDKSFSLIQAR